MQIKNWKIFALECALFLAAVLFASTLVDLALPQAQTAMALFVGVLLLIFAVMISTSNVRFVRKVDVHELAPETGSKVQPESGGESLRLRRRVAALTKPFRGDIEREADLRQKLLYGPGAPLKSVQAAYEQQTQRARAQYTVTVEAADAAKTAEYAAADAAKTAEYAAADAARTEAYESAETRRVTAIEVAEARFNQLSAGLESRDYSRSSQLRQERDTVISTSRHAYNAAFSAAYQEYNRRHSVAYQEHGRRHSAAYSAHSTSVSAAYRARTQAESAASMEREQAVQKYLQEHPEFAKQVLGEHAELELLQPPFSLVTTHSIDTFSVVELATEIAQGRKQATMKEIAAVAANLSEFLSDGGEDAYPELKGQAERLLRQLLNMLN